MKDRGRVTIIIEEKNPSRATSVFGKSKSAPIAASLSVGAEIGGYTITEVIAENTGEATVLLGEKNGTNGVIKLFHREKKPKDYIIGKLTGASCPYVMSYIECGDFGDRFYTVMPYYKNGDLTNFLPVGEDVLIGHVIPSVNEGLKFLHNAGIVHRDIKPANIFFSDDMKTAVIGDFGISSVLDSGVSVRATGMSRTLGYAAPETSAGFVSKETDYYALGITLLQLVTGRDIFSGMTEMQILYQTLNKRLPIPKTVSPRLATVIRGLTQKDREKRWGYEEVSKWIRGEYVKVTDDDVQPVRADGSGFLFENVLYYDLKSLAAAMANDWSAAEIYLFTGALEQKLVGYNSGMSREIASLKNGSNKDIAVFRTLMILDEDIPLCFRGHHFVSPESVGLVMAEKLPDKDTDIIDLVTSGCMKCYMERHNYDKRIIDRLEYITSQLILGKREFYYALLYFLNPKYVYSDKFSNIKELADYLEGLSDEEREKVAGEMIYDRKFQMWVFSKGYWKQLREWLSVCEKEDWE